MVAWECQAQLVLVHKEYHFQVAGLYVVMTWIIFPWESRHLMGVATELVVHHPEEVEGVRSRMMRSKVMMKAVVEDSHQVDGASARKHIIIMYTTPITSMFPLLRY